MGRGQHPGFESDYVTWSYAVVLGFHPLPHEGLFESLELSFSFSPDQGLKAGLRKACKMPSLSPLCWRWGTGEERTGDGKSRPGGACPRVPVHLRHPADYRVSSHDQTL